MTTVSSLITQLFQRDRNKHAALGISFFLTDLIPVNVSRTIPEIRHVNTDGRIPYIAFHSLESKSRVDLILCSKSNDVNEDNTEFNSIFPFAVLSAYEVRVH